jgi:lipid-binding SYLF domain-containing protein
VFALLLTFSLSQAFAADNPAKLTKKCDEAVKIFKAAGESGKFFANSYGYAVFPTIGKGAVGVGGAHGNGCVFEQGKRVGDAEMSQVTVGLSLGGKSYSQIVFFEDKRALDEFRSGSFEFGAEASATMITSAAGAQTSTSGSSAGASGGKNDATTTGSYYKGMATFMVTKGGGMMDASVGGQKFKYKAM